MEFFTSPESVWRAESGRMDTRECWALRPLLKLGARAQQRSRKPRGFLNGLMDTWRFGLVKGGITAKTVPYFWQRGLVSGKPGCFFRASSGLNQVFLPSDEGNHGQLLGLTPYDQGSPPSVGGQSWFGPWLASFLPCHAPLLRWLILVGFISCFTSKSGKPPSQ